MIFNLKKLPILLFPLIWNIFSIVNIIEYNKSNCNSQHRLNLSEGGECIIDCCTQFMIDNRIHMARTTSMWLWGYIIFITTCIGYQIWKFNSKDIKFIGFNKDLPERDINHVNYKMCFSILLNLINLTLLALFINYNYNDEETKDILGIIVTLLYNLYWSYEIFTTHFPEETTEDAGTSNLTTNQDFEEIKLNETGTNTDDIVVETNTIETNTETKAVKEEEIKKEEEELGIVAYE